MIFWTLPLAYLENGMPNVICLDWGKLSTPNRVIQRPFSFLFYGKAVLNVPTVGIQVARFMHFLIKSKVAPSPSSFHLIGHSLGAHVMGCAGYAIRRMTGMDVGRISGLDPAGKSVPNH